MPVVVGPRTWVFKIERWGNVREHGGLSRSVCVCVGKRVARAHGRVDWWSSPQVSVPSMTSCSRRVRVAIRIGTISSASPAAIQSTTWNAVVNAPVAKVESVNTPVLTA